MVKNTWCKPVKWLVVFALVVFLIPASSIPAAAGKTKIRFSHIYQLGPASNPHVWIVKFRELCDKHFPGRFEIEEYGVSSLYRVTEVAKAAATGSVEVGYWAPALAKFGLPKKSREAAMTGLVPGFYGTTSPITVNMHYDFWETHGIEISKTHYEPVGAILKGFFCGNEAFETVSMKPITTLEGFKKLKMRAISYWLVDMAKRLGANPITMSTAEVPGALLTGTVDCAMTWSSPMWRNKWYKTAPYMLPVKLLPGQAMGGWWWNLKFWKSLPDAVRKKFDAFVVECNTYVKQKIAFPLAWNQEELFIADGAKIPEWSPEEIAKVRQKVVEPIKREWGASAGKDGKKMLKWAEEIGKKYTPEMIKKFENTYKGKIYPPGWEHMAKK